MQRILSMANASYTKLRPLLLATVIAAGLVLPAFSAPGKNDKAARAGQVDLNTASEKDLDSLPGVGPATAKKIIAARPYQSVNDLSKAGLPAKEVERLRSMVTVSAAAPARTNSPAPTVMRTQAPANSPAPPPVRAQSPSNSGQANRSQTPQATASTPPPGPGMVWVNAETKVYHRQGDRWYGKTKKGSYMTEADAIKAGYRAAKN
jgi:hypothetical protein